MVKTPWYVPCARPPAFHDTGTPIDAPAANSTVLEATAGIAFPVCAVAAIAKVSAPEPTLVIVRTRLICAPALPAPKLSDDGIAVTAERSAALASSSPEPACWIPGIWPACVCAAAAELISSERY